jgi:hypothetical protein
VIICPSCGTENQDHFRFCQGCGTDVSQVPRGTGGHETAKTDAKMDALDEGTMPAPFLAAAAAAAAAAHAAATNVSTATSSETPAIPPAHEEAPADVVEAPRAEVAHDHPLACAACGHMNEDGNVFCGACGARMPAKPAASAEVRVPSQPVRALDRTSLGGISPLASAPKPVRFTLTLLRVDGTDAGVHNCADDHAVIGRETGGIFASDASLSPLHARFERRGDRLFVTDSNSLNGVYRRLVRNVPQGLENGDGFRIGQEVLRYELLPQGDAGSDVQTLGSPRHGVRARIVSVIGRGEYGNASSIPAGGLLLGRERGDVLFPEDGYVSGLHCRLHHDGNQAFIMDLGSSNGTFVRLRGETELGANDVLLMGQQLFRVGIT